jgi:hypothetical protein
MYSPANTTHQNFLTTTEVTNNSTCLTCHFLNGLRILRGFMRFSHDVLFICNHDRRPEIFLTTAFFTYSYSLFFCPAPRTNISAAFGTFRRAITKTYSPVPSQSLMTAEFAASVSSRSAPETRMHSRDLPTTRFIFLYFHFVAKEHDITFPSDIEIRVTLLGR